MTIPLARIHHLEQAIRRRRRYARNLNSRRDGCMTDAVADYYADMYHIQLVRVSKLLEALHRSRTVYHHNAAKLETTKV